MGRCFFPVKSQKAGSSIFRVNLRKEEEWKMDNKTNTRTGRWRPYDQLTMADEFLFDKMMQNPEICKGVLERILESGITNFAFSKSGECMDITYRGTDARVFVRMLDDTNTYYEPDTGRWGMAVLPRRMRFDVTTTDIFLCENVCVQDDLQELIVVYNNQAGKLPLVTVCR